MRFFKNPSVKQAVFLISADDQALRRHLEAKEAASSGVRDPKEISQYVEEYLRKFFTAAIRIRPLLDEDIRTYTDGELRDFAETNDLTEETRTSLVEMVAAALSGNPRRVRQFSKNLEARLLVIRERQEKGRIDPPISDQVLVIAKLAILEEEWPNSFRVLEDDPRALDQWHRHVIEGTAVDVPDWGDPAFRRFLSTSREVRADNLNAFIRLKQSQHEIKLPRYDEFQDALLQGDYVIAEEILGTATGQAAEYAGQLARLLDDQLTHGYLDAARAVVEAAVTVPGLAENVAVTRAIVRRAVGDSDLRPRLRSVRPTPLFQASRLLDDADRGLLLSLFVDLESFLNESPERLEQVLEAFASVATTLPSSIAASVKQELAKDAIAVQAKALLPIAHADPEVLPVQVASAALNTLQETFDVDSAAYAVMTQWVRRGNTEELEATFLDAATLAVTAATALSAPVTSDRLAAMFERLPVDFAQLREVPSASAQAFLGALDQPLSLWAQPLWPGVVETAATLGVYAEEIGSLLVSRLVSEFFAAAPADALVWATGRGEHLAKPLRATVMAQLAALGAQEQDQRDDAIAAIASIDPAGELGGFRHAIVRFLGANLFHAPLMYIRKYEKLAEPHIELFVDTALASARETSEVNMAAAFAFFAGLFNDMTTVQQDELRDLLVSRLGTRDVAAIETASVAARSLRGESQFRDRLREVVAFAFDQLKSDPQPRALVSFVAENLASLSPSERSAFIALLGRLVGEPEDREGTLEAVSKLPSLDAPQREVIVQALVNAEVLDPAEDERVVLLRATDSIAGSRGKPRQIVKDRLAELAIREGVDAAVHRRVTFGDPPEPQE